MVNPMSAKKSVLLVGLGGIACSYDYQDMDDSSTESRTHFTAATKAGLKIVGGIDPDPIAREAFESNCKMMTWRSLSDLRLDSKIDIVVVATSSETHKAVIEEIVEKIEPSAIICEKPFGNSNEDSKSIINLLATRKIPMLVNYTREFSKARRDISKYIDSEKFVTGSFTYSHGLRRSGSHFIRLVVGILGVPRSVINFKELSISINPSFRLIYSRNRHFDFIGTDTVEFRVATGEIEFSDRILTIYEGSNLIVNERPNKSSSPFWPSEGKTIFDSQLIGGLDEIYRDLSWISASRREEITNWNSIDQACSAIMDEVS
jgi:hypothetical protein